MMAFFLTRIRQTDFVCLLNYVIEQTNIRTDEI
jgi:hypothetical protein